MLSQNAMNKEIVSDPLEAEDLWNDLNSNIALLTSLNIRLVLMFFGFSWGNKIYPGNWHDIPAVTKDIKDTIINFERAGHGSLASDNLELFVPEYNVRIHYSYEADIHLSYLEENAFVQPILNRWTINRWLLVHWSKQKGKI